MELVDVVQHVGREQLRVDELATVRSNRHVLEHVEVCDLGVLLDHDHVLDTDAELTVLVEARLITDAHALFKLDFLASGDADRALMDAEGRADTVARSMLEVETSLEEVLPRKDVEVRTVIGAGGWPDDTLNVKGSEEDACVRLLLKS